jgi:two-component system response regulator FixJ
MIRQAYIVDDDAPVRASLLGLLSATSASLARGFASGDAFLAEMMELEPGVVILDVNMPGASGIDVLAAIGAAGRLSHLVPIVVTGQGNIAMAVQAMRAGALDFLEKPYDHATLLAFVEEGFRQIEEADSAGRRERLAKDKLARLSARETDVLTGLIAGRPNKVIAYDLGISPRTVEIYRANLMDKLEVRSLSEALRIAFTAGLIID